MSATGDPFSNEQPAGSPSPGEPVYLLVGRLQRPHGIRGEINLQVITDFPERLRQGITVYVGEEHRPLRIRTRRKHQRDLLLSFDDFDSVEAVGTLRSLAVYVSAGDRPPLPEGEFYHHQLLGLRVVTRGGAVLGRVAEILQTGANDVLVVRPDFGSEILIPVVDDFVDSIRPEQGEITINPAPGLLPED